MRRVLIKRHREAESDDGGGSGGGDSNDGGGDNDDGATDVDDEEVQLLTPALPNQEKASASLSKKQLRVHTAGPRADNTASSDHDFQQLARRLKPFARRKNGTGGGDKETPYSNVHDGVRITAAPAWHFTFLVRWPLAGAIT
jgi:hypothetical protein